MIKVDENKLVLLIEDALWCFDSYNKHYVNTMNYFYDMLQENSLYLSDRELQKVYDAIEKRLEELRSEENRNE